MFYNVCKNLNVIRFGNSWSFEDMSSYHWLVGDPKLIPVDILAKVQDVRELPKKSDFEKVIWSIIARLFAENSDARLAGIVI